MKLNRITSLAAVLVAVLIVVGQFVSGVKAAPPPKYNASFSAKVDKSTAPAVNKGSKPSSPTDQSPLDLTVQGRLTDHSGNPITTATGVVFNLYDVPSGGTALLTQSATVTPDLNGLFTYIFIVDTSSNWNNVLDFDLKLYMGITVGSDTEMTPRFELTAAPYAMSLAPGAEIAGNFDYGTNHDNGLLNLYNTNSNNSESAGLYASGPRGVWGRASSNSGGSSAGGYFTNDQSDSGNLQYGVYAVAGSGIGVVGVGAQTYGNAGGDFSGYSGIHSNGDGATTTPSNDGVDAGGAGGSSYGYYTTQPSGDTNFSFYGYAHIHGTNVSAASYELEVSYHGSDAAQLGDVLALDGNNETVDGTQVLGVVKADANNANAAVGVLAYRLDTAKVNGADKTIIDANATQIKSGDRAYIVIAGQVQMKVSGSVNIGDRLGIASNGSITATKDSADSIGKVASKPDANGMVTVVVNFK